MLALLLALALLETVDPPDAVYAPKRTISRDRLLMAKNIRTYKNVIILVKIQNGCNNLKVIFVANSVSQTESEKRILYTKID